MKLDEKAVEAAWDTLPQGSTLISRKAFRCAIRAYFTAIPSAAVAEREPLAFPECVLGLIDGMITLAFETPDDAQTAFDIIERTISDPPPSALADNERLKAERDECARKWSETFDSMHQRALAAEAERDELIRRDLMKVDGPTVERCAEVAERPGAFHDARPAVASAIRAALQEGKE